MADQAITALPKKTYSGSSQIASTDYLLGIDSAEGYQMLIQDLGEYIINRATASLAGSTQTLASAISALNSKLFKQLGANLSDEAFNALTADGLYVGYIPTTSCPCKQQWAYINVKSLSANANDVMQEVIGITSAITCTRMKNNGTWGSWVLAPTRAEMDAATVKTLTVTATADANGYIDTGLKYNQAVPLCVYSVTINGSAAYPFLYEFLMRGGSPAEKIAVRLKRWNGEVHMGEVTFSMKYI